MEKDLCVLSQSADSSNGAEPTTELPPSKRLRGAAIALLGNVFMQKGSQSPTDKARSEVRKYNLEDVLDLDTDPLKWWSERCRLYPLLSQLVQKNLSVVGTSVPSE